MHLVDYRLPREAAERAAYALDRSTGRPIQFYRPTRAQAPHYAKVPHLRHSFECSICRGLFLRDTPAERHQHRQAHLTPSTDGTCGHPGCADEQIHQLARCSVCGEDLCPDFRCLRWHRDHDCRIFQHAATLDDDAAEEYLERSLHSRFPTQGVTMSATTKKSSKRSTAATTRTATKGKAKVAKAQPRKGVVETYGSMTDEQMVRWATSRKPWYSTRAGQIEAAGVKGFRARVRKALEAATAKKSKKAAA